MEKKQTIGRTWRDGQKEQVFVFEIIAPGTCDEMSGGLAL
jgi:SNF2 family DNA or RNA helicase